MIPPSGSGRSAPLAAMSVALRKDPRTPHVLRAGGAHRSMRRGASASRWRYQSAPPWDRRHDARVSGFGFSLQNPENRITPSETCVADMRISTGE